MHKVVVAPLQAPQRPPEPWPRPRRRPAAREKALALAMVSLLFLAGVAVVAQTVRLNALGYELAQVRREVALLERSNGRLELEVARLKDPARLAQLATDTLGLVEPDAAHVERVPAAAIARARLAVRGGSEPVLVAADQRPRPWPMLAQAFSRWWAANEGEQVANN